MHYSDETYPNREANSTDQFESDTQKLMHRHLQDKNHVITEEELKSIRIGTAPVQAADSPEITGPVEPPVMP